MTVNSNGLKRAMLDLNPWNVSKVSGKTPHDIDFRHFLKYLIPTTKKK